MSFESKGRNPLVSVIMPAYNAEHYLEECLASVDAQSYRNLEIIVVDDGSTDGTLRVLRDHASRDARITVLAQDNLYAGVARNNGMAKANGDYLLFLDSDDIFEPDMIELLVTRAEETGADVAMCRSSSFDEQTGETKPIDHALCKVDLDRVYENGELDDILFQFCSGWAWDKLYRADFARATGLSFQPLRTTNDAFFVFMSLALASSIAFVDSCCVRHRSGNSASLEGSRSKSADNALIAMRSIGEELRKRGIYQRYKRSYFNWVVNFSIWNVYTLAGDARRQYIAKLLEVLPEDFAEEADPEYYYEAIDGEVAAFIREDEIDSIAHAIDVELELRWRREEMEVIGRRLAELSGCDEELRSILESRTYKVGKAIMAVPCAIKDALIPKKTTQD